MRPWAGACSDHLGTVFLLLLLVLAYSYSSLGVKKPLQLRERKRSQSRYKSPPCETSFCDKARNKAAQAAAVKDATRVPVNPQANTFHDDTASNFEIIDLDGRERFKRVIRLTLNSNNNKVYYIAIL